MIMKQVLQIRCKNNKKSLKVPIGSTLSDIYRENNLQMTYGPVSAKVNNKVEGLHYRVYHNKDVEYLDLHAPSGIRTYTRSLFLVLCKAVHDLYPGSSVVIDIPVSNGYYCNLKLGHAVTPDDVRRIRTRMQEIIDARLPIQRFETTTEEAVEMFNRLGDGQKAKLLRSSGTLYSVYYVLDDYKDYYYGSMLTDTGQIHLFGLEPYFDGVLLRIPSAQDPSRLGELIRQDKMFEVFKEHHRWQGILGIKTVGDFNEAVKKGFSTDLINVSGAQTYDAQGALRMTTVSVSGCPGYPVTALDVIHAWFDPDEVVLDRDQVCPRDVTAEQQHEVEQAQMTSSQDTAVTAALMETGQADSMILTVKGTSEERGDGVFKAGDVIRSITPAGGQTTTPSTYAQLQELMTTIAPGTEVQVVVSRDGQDTSLTMTTLEPGKDSGRQGSLLGVMLDVRANSDVNATFSLSDVGGPSAGSMFALGIIDKTTPGDLTGGKDIAGTGTISSDGTIGPIGGISQKMAGASDAGSQYFLAPASNCADVVGHEPKGMEVYAVSNLHEAVQAVEGIAAGDTSSLTTCQAVTTR